MPGTTAPEQTTSRPKVRAYHLTPTPLIPNSPYPLLHYPSILRPLINRPGFNGTHIDDVFRSNGWHTQWIVRYGPTQGSHYHSHAHECMAVISGDGAKIRFGAADTSPDLDESTYGGKFEQDLTWTEVVGGVKRERRGELVLEAGLGDVFVIPAGVAHKTHDPKPDSPGLRQMASKSGHLSEKNVESARKQLEGVVVDGYFMMCGAYPVGQDWDWKEGGEGRDEVQWENVWGVGLPRGDPVMGDSVEGTRGLWKEEHVEKWLQKGKVARSRL